jgi:hypothetical protein
MISKIRFFTIGIVDSKIDFGVFLLHFAKKALYELLLAMAP